MNTTINCLADHDVQRAGLALIIQSPQGAASTWGWDPASRRLQCESAAVPTLGAALAAIGAALSDLDGGPHAGIALQAPAPLQASLRALGVALPGAGASLSDVTAGLFWQCQDAWLAQPAPPLPLEYRMTDGRRHPLRRTKPQGEVYRRRIPWLGQTLSFQVADVEADLPHFHRWMNDPHVAEFWQEEGDLARQRAYLERISADAHALPLIAFLDGRPFGYFEAYWAREDRIAPYYDVDDYDRGWHVLIGEPDCRGAAFVSAWLPSISHYLFLDDPRTRRLVIEPRADNRRMRRNLARSGYALVKEFDFPHKRALLGTLSRERFFAERLWLPQPA